MANDVLLDVAETTALVPPAFESLLNRLRDHIVNGGYSPPALATRERGVSFVAPFEGRERLFQDNGEPAPVTLADPLLEGFIFRQRRTPLAYGYPVFLEPSGQLSPLFYCPTTLRLGSDGKLIADRAPRAETSLNRRLLTQLGLPKSATARLQRELGSGRPSAFANSLSQLCRMLGIEPECGPQAITPLPAPGSEQASPAWANSAILFADGRTTVDSRLLAELKLVEGAAQLDACVLGSIERSTAASDTDAIPLKLPLVPIPLELMEVLGSCLAERYSVVEAPPGGGKLALIIDLLASACASRISTLYIAPRRALLEHVTQRLQTLAEIDHPCVIPLQGLQATRNEVLDGLSKSKASEPDEADEDARNLDELAQRLTRMQQLADRIAPLRDAADRVIEAQQARIAAESQCRDAWSALFDADHDITVDTVQLAQWEAEAAELAALQSDERDDAKVSALTRSLHDTLIPLPDDRWAELPIALSEARSPETAIEPDALAKAFNQLQVFAEWHAATKAEREAVESWLGSPPARSFLPQLGAGQQAVSRASARVLSRRRRMEIEGLGSTTMADKVREVFRLSADRQATSGDTSAEREQDPLVAAIADAAAVLPLWTIEAGEVQGALPAAPGLFDLVVIDDAEEMDGATLLTILLRARSAVVFGSLIHGDRDSEDDGLGVALSLLRRPTLKITEHRRCHPRIALYISETFHGGALRILVDRRMMLWDRHYPSLSGVHWHQPSVSESPGGNEAEDIVRLVASWKEGGAFDGDRPFSLAVVTPFPERSDQLGRAVRSVLPDGHMAKSLIVGGPEALSGRITDLLVLLPGITPDMPPARASLLASNPILYHDAVGAARIGVHVIADEILCRQAGGPLADLLSHAVGSGSTPTGGEDEGVSEATQNVLGITRDLDQHALVEPDGTLVVFTPFGRIYRLAIGPSPVAAGWDLSPSAARPRLLLDPKMLQSDPDRIRAMLARLA